MSWDAYLYYNTCERCGQSGTVEVRNVTYNNGRIFELLGVHPNYLEGKLCNEVTALLQKAIELSYEKEAEARKLEPPKGWGGLNDSRNFLVALLDKCKKNPKAKIGFHDNVIGLPVSLSHAP